jgi:hypothetical protein
MNFESCTAFSEWLKDTRWKDMGIPTVIDGKLYCICVDCQYKGSIRKQGNSWDIGNFSRHLVNNKSDCPERKHDSQVLSSSTSSSAEHIMETEDVSSILSLINLYNVVNIDN